MAAPKKPGGNAGKGRPKGAVNKLTADIKGMILGALGDVGGQTYLARQAEENPGPFLTLIGKVLPTTIAGDAANPVKVELTVQMRRAAALAAIDAAFGGLNANAQNPFGAGVPVGEREP